MKKALITGASGEIGLEIVRLLKDDYIIYAHTFQNRERLENNFAEEIAEGKLYIVQADLNLSQGADKLLSQIPLSIDLLVLCAGCAQYGLFTDTTNVQYEAMTNLHLINPMKITQGLLTEMIARKGGNIIFVSSIWGQVGASYEVLYATLKGAQNTFVKSLAKEVAPSNIRVNAVMPGVVDTRMIKELSSDELKELAEEIPMGRFAQPNEVADVIGFLSNTSSRYMTGTIIPITGGWYMT